MEELASSLQNFNRLLGAATTAHKLVPDQFDWLWGEVRHPMEPQPILESLPLWPWHVEAPIHDSYGSNVTVYGGGVANRHGDFHYGHVSGHIAEPTPQGTKHQSNRHDPPVPYIPRILTIKNQLVTVRTPEKNLPTNQGPAVFEGMNGYGRWATVTCYDSRSGKLTVRSGDFITDGQGQGRSYDRTVSEDAHQFPPAIMEARVATMVRTLNSAADILDKIALHDSERAKWRVTYDHALSGAPRG